MRLLQETWSQAVQVNLSDCLRVVCVGSQEVHLSVHWNHLLWKDFCHSNESLVWCECASHSGSQMIRRESFLNILPLSFCSPLPPCPPPAPRLSLLFRVDRKSTSMRAPIPCTWQFKSQQKTCILGSHSGLMLDLGCKINLHDTLVLFLCLRLKHRTNHSCFLRQTARLYCPELSFIASSKLLGQDSSLVYLCAPRLWTNKMPAS